MRVLVTGGAGFIGQHTRRELAVRGHQAIVFDHLGRGDDRTFLGDVRDPTAVTEAMAHVNGWIHLAGVLGTQETVKNPRPAIETNIIGTLNVLQAAYEYDVPGVYIAVGNHWFRNSYSITKTCAEHLCEMYRKEHHVAVNVVRPVNAYGIGQRAVGTIYVRSCPQDHPGVCLSRAVRHGHRGLRRWRADKRYGSQRGRRCHDISDSTRAGGPRQRCQPRAEK